MRRMARRALVSAVVAGVAGAVVGAVVVSGPGTSATSPAADGLTTSQESAAGLQVALETPTPGTLLGPTTTLTVTFSRPLAGDATLPALPSGQPGTWTRTGPESLTFTPSTAWAPESEVEVTIPAGIEASNGAKLGQSQTLSWRVGSGTTLGLEELLASLHYLPLRFTPAAGQPSPLAQPALASYATVPGTFSWRFPEPATLTGQWLPGTDNVLLNGAVMAFEHAHNLAINSIPSPQVWTAVVQAAESHSLDPYPYTYVSVRKTLPETLTVYSNGANVFQSLANTGIPSRPTANGTFAVYERFRSTTMRGTNPNGTPYDDPGVPDVNYFNGGDAIHGFIRASYGFPQSLGCVELPYSSAKVVFGLINYGTLVTILPAA